MSNSDLKVVRPILGRALVFLIPFYLLILGVMLVDPYDFFGRSRLIHKDIKKEVSLYYNPVLWKTLQFGKSPMANILLGDSRMYNMDVDDIRSVSGASFYNFAYTGGTLAEAIDTFWFAQRQIKLNQVVIGISLTVFNSADDMNRFQDTQAILNRPMMYFINADVLQSGYNSVKAQSLERHPQFRMPERDTQEDWANQTGSVINGFYYRYSYPVHYAESLEKISRYCRENGIDLVFVLLPTHVDIQGKIAAYHLESADRVFRSEIERLGRVLDFDYPNAMTMDVANFMDPFHANEATCAKVAGEIFGPGREFVRVTGTPTTKR